MNKVKLIECPRDAMQGIKSHFIATDAKAQYINALLRVGFDTIDFGSFVSPKAIPQMRDTADVLSKLDLSRTESKLLAIVANVRGAEDASRFEEIDYLGYPFSISGNFQMRNTGKTILESIVILNEILAIADNSTPKTIGYLFSNLIQKYSNIEFGAHLHTTPTTWFEKVDAAYKAGCNRFDGAIKGYGGCPMATDELTGNMPTEKLISYFNQQKATTNINAMSFESAYNEALKIF
jgi:hydroxymethylglutaryl-CoA lyase